MLSECTIAAVRRSAAALAVRCRIRGLNDATILDVIVTANVEAARALGMGPRDVNAVESEARQAVKETLARYSIRLDEVPTMLTACRACKPTRR